MVQLSFPFARAAEHRRPRREWRPRQPTKLGVRERLIAQGFIPGTAVYRFAYHKVFAEMFPEVIRAAKTKFEDTRAAAEGRLRFHPRQRAESGRFTKGPRRGR